MPTKNGVLCVYVWPELSEVCKCCQ